MAEGVEKVAEGAVKHLPKGKLHDAAKLVEKVAQDIDKHAQNAEDVLEKVLTSIRFTIPSALYYKLIFYLKPISSIIIKQLNVSSHQPWLLFNLEF